MVILIMHPFATDSPERKTIVFYIAILSILIAIGLSRLPEEIRLYIPEFSIPWWFDYPSVAGVFAVIYELFNANIWRLALLRKLGLIRVPDLGGKWKGTLFTSHDENKKRYDVSVTIEQNWTEMSMCLKTDQSESYTITSSILVKQPNGVTLIYHYFDEPKNIAVESMHSHRGTGVLKLLEDNILEGEYYTGRDRLTHGTIHLEKIEH